MNPNDLFWLARYAHTVVSPLVREDERLKIILEFCGQFPGVDVWIHAPGHVRVFKTNITNKGQVDQFVATLKPLETGIAA